MRARLSFVLAFFLGLLALPSLASAQPLIVIDAGHGGTDPGAVGCSIIEANVVLDVALRLRTELEAAGIRVALTRDVDEFVALSARADFANSMSADGFVSVHSNSNAGTPATGTETWIANAAGDRSLSLATLLQDEMIMTWGLRDRGVKRADFVVVRDTTMPAALTELAFTNNCTTDATFLSDPTQRQAMAEAQARAILAWLGVSPGMTGTLRGVVFEDQGVGTMDLSVRLPGATVRVVETGASVAADATEAAWLFDLPPGTYTVEASAPGHTTETRSCDVTSGGTTWCSVGLFPTSMPTPDAGTDAAVMAAPDAAASTTPDAATSSSADAASTPAPDAGTTMRPTAGDCSCSVASPAPARSGLLALAGLALTLLVVRARSRARGRARRLAAIASLALGASACSTSDPAAPATSELSRTAPSIPSPTLERVEQGPAVRILGERELLVRTPEGALVTAPFVSPDGATVLVASTDFHALYAWREERLTPLCTTQHCGYEPRFFGEGLVATRTPEQSASAIPGDAVTLAGTRATERMGARGALAWVEDEDTVRVRIDGATRTLRAHDDRFVRAELSPDHRHVLVWGLVQGVSLHRLSDGARFDLGVAGHPHFDPDGRALLFDRTDDEGHTLTAGDVYLAELGPEIVVRPVLTTTAIETSPTLSRIDADGHATLAAERDGAIVLAEIALSPAD